MAGTFELYDAAVSLPSFLAGASAVVAVVRFRLVWFQGQGCELVWSDGIPVLRSFNRLFLIGELALADLIVLVNRRGQLGIQ